MTTTPAGWAPAAWAQHVELHTADPTNAALGAECGGMLHVPSVCCQHCDRTSGSFIKITRQEHDGGHGPDVWVCLAHWPRVGQRRAVRG